MGYLLVVAVFVILVVLGIFALSAAMAGVPGHHCLGEPLPWVGAGWGTGRRRLAWGKQQL